MRKEFGVFATLVCLVLGVGFASPALAQDRTFSAVLDSYQGTPFTLATSGRGLFSLRLNRSENQAEFALSYGNLDGGGVTAAHIHLGRPSIGGGISAVLCGPPKPACSPSGTVTGTLRAMDIIGPGTQGLTPANFREFVEALRRSATYVDVHTVNYQNGEIRGAIRP